MYVIAVIALTRMTVNGTLRALPSNIRPHKKKSGRPPLKEECHHAVLQAQKSRRCLRIAVCCQRCNVRRRLRNDREQGPSAQRAERAAKLAHDEWRLRLDALLKVEPDKPRQC